MDLDSIVVGAGPAGLSAALTLGRARRRVLVLDSGEYRNHAARHMHGVLGHDGLDPAELRARASRSSPATASRCAAPSSTPRPPRADADGVEVAGERARTLVIATGLVDDTPRIDGFDAIYGVSAHTCPYCDGWEHRDRRIAVLAPVERGDHLGRLLRQWSPDVVLLTGGGPGVGADEEAASPGSACRWCASRSGASSHEDGRLTAIEFEGREPLGATRSSSTWRCARGPSSPPRWAASERRPGTWCGADDPRDERRPGPRRGQLRRPVAERADGDRGRRPRRRVINFRLVEDGIVQPR